MAVMQCGHGRCRETATYIVRRPDSNAFKVVCEEHATYWISKEWNVVKKDGEGIKW